MNKSIIESIYNTERFFNEENIDTEEYFNAKKELCETYEKLLSVLSNEQQILLDEIFMLQSGIDGAAYSKKFKDGFLLGFKLAEEIFKSD